LAYSKTIEEFFDKHKHRAEELRLLRDAVKHKELKETIKWGSPVYTYHGTHIVGLGAFKSYVGLWFFQGALLEDPENKLISAQQNKTKALRQWRFDSAEEIRENMDMIREYVNEAIINEKEGKSIKPERGKKLVIPVLLKHMLDADEGLSQKFGAFSPGKQREFAEFISEAKREETKQKRLEKIRPMIMEGVGLNDKYKS
jgi:uncharacterized protein YdeI (YjbR/CyaY-like superfamily)